MYVIHPYACSIKCGYVILAIPGQITAMIALLVSQSQLTTTLPAIMLTGLFGILTCCGETRQYPESISFIITCLLIIIIQKHLYWLTIELEHLTLYWPSICFYKSLTYSACWRIRSNAAGCMLLWDCTKEKWGKFADRSVQIWSRSHFIGFAERRSNAACDILWRIPSQSLIHFSGSNRHCKLQV